MDIIEIGYKTKHSLATRPRLVYFLHSTTRTAAIFNLILPKRIAPSLYLSFSTHLTMIHIYIPPNFLSALSDHTVSPYHGHECCCDSHLVVDNNDHTHAFQTSPRGRLALLTHSRAQCALSDSIIVHM